GRREYKLAIGDVHLTATEVHGVHAVLDGVDDIFGRVLARKHVGVGHARHRNVLIALTTAIAGVRNAHQTRRQLVGEIPLQDAILDEHGVLGLVAFVVDVERAPASGHGAVV